MEGEEKPLCKFGKDCYRTSDDHLKRFRHEEECKASAVSKKPHHSSEEQSDHVDLGYGMPFPNEVITIWSVANQLSPKCPRGAFQGITLVGPFEVLDGVEFKSQSDLWMRCRGRYDPPEVTTVAVLEDGRHLCYHRDSPSACPTMVVAGAKGMPSFTIISTTLCEALYVLSDKNKPVQSILCEHLKLDSAAKAKDITNTASTRRKKAIVAQTFSGLGICVPYDKRTEVGYREPMVTPNQLKAIGDAINKGALSSHKQELWDTQLRFADIANDESDFGLSLELGLNILTLVQKNNSLARECARILDISYDLLNRKAFAAIAKEQIQRLVMSSE